MIIRGCEFRVIVVDEKRHIPRIILEIPDQLSCLLRNPGCVRVCRAACQLDTPGSQFYEEQHIDGLERDRLHREEIASQDLVLAVPQEAAPRTSRSL
jgi:hypothetical protein